MKQFQYVRRGQIYGPFNGESAQSRLHAKFEASLGLLSVGETFTDEDGDVWTRLPDVVLQDDAPLTGKDVAECRESAVRVRDKLRLERIATAALQGLCANSYDGHLNQPLSTASYAEMAVIAVDHAKALIAELDKQA